MLSATWSNPTQRPTNPGKCFFTERPLHYDGNIGLLNSWAQALNGIDSGQLWNIQPNLIPLPQIGDDAFELWASAGYVVGGRKGFLTMSAVSQTRQDGQAHGLGIQIGDQIKRMPLPWTEPESERIVAITLMFALDQLRAFSGYPRNSPEAPFVSWHWDQRTVGMGWQRRQTVFYAGWSVELGV